MISVLYVDDEIPLLEIGRLFLESPGEFTVDTSASALDVLERGDLSRYDAIVSDYQMPEMDGIGFLKNVRSRFGNIPFILFTGKGREEVVIQAINEGADFYLQKGGDPRAQFAELRHKIRIAVERCRVVDRLKESERRLLDIINFLPDATFAIDRDGRVIAWNRAIEEMTGTCGSAILGKGDHAYALPVYGEQRPVIIDLILGDDPVLAAQYPSLERSGQMLSAETTSPYLYGGRGAVLRITAAPLYDTHGALVGAIESIRDITGQKQAEEALRASEERYRNVVEDQTEFISRFLPDGTHVFVNEAYCRYFGLDRAAVIGHRFRPMVHPEDDRQVRAFFASLTRENPVGIIEHRIIMPDGTVRWQRWSDRAIFDSSGKIVEYQSVGRDTTGQMEAGIRLRESEKRLSEIIEFLPNATLAIDRDGRVIVWNRAIEQMTGIPASAMLGKGGHAYAIPFYGEARPLMVDLIFEESPEIATRYQNLRHEGQTITAEVFCSALNNSTGAWVLARASPLRDASGRIVGAIESIRDISDIRNAERALGKKNEDLNAALEQIRARDAELRKKYDELAASRQKIVESSERYRSLFEAMHDCVAVYRAVDGGRDFEILEFNRAAEQTEQIPRERVIGRRVTEVFPGVAEIGVLAALRRVSENGVPEALPVAYYHDERISGWRENYLYRLPGGEVVANYRDETENKLAGEALRESEAKYRLLAETSPDMVYLIGTDGTVRFVNSHAAEAFDASPGDLIGKDLAALFPPEAARHHLEGIRRVMETRQPVSHEIPENLPSGRLWIEARLTPVIGPDGTVSGVLGISRDITGRKEAGEALRESRERFRALVVASSDVVYCMSPDWTEMRRLSGRDFIADTRQPSRTWLQTYIPPEDRGRVLAVIHEAVRTKGTFELEHRVFRVDGSTGWTFSRAIPILDSDGEITEWFGMAADVTERKRREEELREIGEQYRSIFESVSDGLIIFDRDGRIAEANPAACAMHGYTRDEMVGLSGTAIVHPRFHSRFAEFLGTATGEVFFEEPLDIRKDGSVFPLTVRGRFFDLRGAPHVIAVITDMSGSRKAGSTGPAKRGEPGLITTDSAPL